MQHYSFIPRHRPRSRPRQALTPTNRFPSYRGILQPSASVSLKHSPPQLVTKHLDINIIYLKVRSTVNVCSVCTCTKCITSVCTCIGNVYIMECKGPCFRRHIKLILRSFLQQALMKSAGKVDTWNVSHQTSDLRRVQTWLIDFPAYLMNWYETSSPLHFPSLVVSPAECPV